MATSRIRLVTFDILHTLIVPRKPVYVQYAEVFRPYLGVLEPEALKASFKDALKQVQTELPAYRHGASAWWSEVIKRTALGAGADPEKVEESLEEIVPALLHRFSSREGYRAFDDALPVVTELQKAGIHVGIISNGDSRFREVLEDLDFPLSMKPIALSEELGNEKPSPDIFAWAIKQHNIVHPHEDELTPEECLHIGDELDCDYQGAKAAGFQTRLLRRPGEDGEQAHKEDNEKLDGVDVIESLNDVLDIAATESELTNES